MSGSFARTILDGLLRSADEAEHRDRAAKEAEEALGAALPYEEWLRTRFPHVASRPLAERHHRLYRWIDSLRPGVKPKARVEVWCRGGGKSTSVELAIVRLGTLLTRRFVLCVSGTQTQADGHVQSIAAYFETLGIQRAVTQYGASKGWNRSQLRTASGFNVSALGLDAAVRGIKIEQYRPDLIVFDDIDSQDDTPATVAKKLSSIRTAILPAGSTDLATLFLQNLIHEDSICTRLVDGRADFLLDRDVPPISRAVENLSYELRQLESGANAYRITGGTPSWLGQDLATCEAQLNEWGLEAFLREAQHEVYGAGGYYFDHTKMEAVPAAPAGVPMRCCRAWDLAATEGGGDWTVGVLMGRSPSGVCHVLDVQRVQYESKKVRSLILETARKDIARFGKVRVHLPQDPGQAGKDQAQQLREMLDGHDVTIQPISGNKAVRARGWADCVNAGNAKLVAAPWNEAYRHEHRKFREDLAHEADDQVDASADAYNELQSFATSARSRSYAGYA